MLRLSASAISTETGKADACIVGRFVALDRLLLESDFLGELALREAAGDARTDQGDR